MDGNRVPGGVKLNNKTGKWEIVKHNKMMKNKFSAQVSVPTRAHSQLNNSTEFTIFFLLQLHRLSGTTPQSSFLSTSSWKRMKKNEFSPEALRCYSISLGFTGGLYKSIEGCPIQKKKWWQIGIGIVQPLKFLWNIDPTMWKGTLTRFKEPT